VVGGARLDADALHEAPELAPGFTLGGGVEAVLDEFLFFIKNEIFNLPFFSFFSFWTFSFLLFFLFFFGLFRFYFFHNFFYLDFLFAFWTFSYLVSILIFFSTKFFGFFSISLKNWCASTSSATSMVQWPSVAASKQRWKSEALGVP
jgi:hypothetical protein